MSFQANGSIYPGNLQTMGVGIARNTEATADNVTLTVNQMINSLLLRNAGSATPTDTTPTANQLIGALGADSVANRTSFMFIVKNSGSNTQTLAPGTNVTISGAATTATLTTHWYLGTVTAMGPLATPTVKLESLMVGLNF